MRAGRCRPRDAGADTVSAYFFFDVPLCFACARSEPATDFTVLLVLGLLSNLLALEASFLLVVIRSVPSAAWAGNAAKDLGACGPRDIDSPLTEEYLLVSALELGAHHGPWSVRPRKRG